MLPEEELVRHWDVLLRAPIRSSSYLGGERWLIEDDDDGSGGNSSRFGTSSGNAIVKESPVAHGNSAKIKELANITKLCNNFGANVFNKPSDLRGCDDPKINDEGIEIVDDKKRK